MKKLFFVLISIGMLLYNAEILSKNTINSYLITLFSNATENKFFNRAEIIKKFIGNNSKYNSEFAFIIDMKILSGKKRFFVYDLKNNKIVDQGLVSHGIGSQTKTEGELIFSNEPNSLSTSLGKYSIGSSYNGKFGKAYKLFGLEQTNNKAFARNIVLHKYSKVPFDEQDQPICKSLGCPMLNVEFYKRIETLIDNSKTNIILDIVY